MKINVKCSLFVCLVHVMQITSIEIVVNNFITRALEDKQPGSDNS